MTATAPHTHARPMPAPLRYDLKIWIASRGRERVFRARQLELASLTTGETVLDVGCGTGTLAIAAARRVGTTGAVTGVDPSEALLGRARKKARRARVAATFIQAGGEKLPFADASFDLVLSTLVFHHLPHDVLRSAAQEIRRVLKPNGRLLAVDMGGEQDAARATMHSAPGHHAHFDLDAMAERLPNVGLDVVETGPIESGIRRLERLRYVLARAAA
jgi:ubiquinone/menaquinone biosynthesis C-methylase UbiE